MVGWLPAWLWLFSTVHVTSAISGQLVAMGQVTYRLLEPWPEG